MAARSIVATGEPKRGAAGGGGGSGGGGRASRCSSEERVGRGSSIGVELSIGAEDAPLRRGRKAPVLVRVGGQPLSSFGSGALGRIRSRRLVPGRRSAPLQPGCLRGIWTRSDPAAAPHARRSCERRDPRSAAAR